jgi:hypothetical protein
VLPRYLRAGCEAAEGVSVSNLQAEGFSPSPFLVIPSLRLDVKLMPLFEPRLDVSSFALERPKLLLEVNRQGRANYSSLTSGGRPPEGVPGAKPGAGGAAAFALPHLLVNGAAVDYLDYLDYRDSSAIRVRNLDLAMEVSGEGSAVRVTGVGATDSLSYGTVERPLLSGLHLRLDHQVLYDLSSDQLRIERGDLAFQQLRLILAGNVSAVTGDPVLDLTVGSDSVNIADLFSLIPGEYREKTGGAKGEGTSRVRIAITGTLSDSSPAEIAGSVTARGATLQYAGLPKPITDITVLSSFTRTRTKEEFRIDDLSASLGGAPIRLAMTLTDFDDPWISLRAGGTLDLATLPQYYPLDPGTELGGTVALEVRLAGRVSLPDAMKAGGSLTFHDVTARTAEMSNPVRRVNGTVTFNNDAAESRQLSMVIGSSDMTVA